MHIFDTTTNIFIDCDVAPINSNTPVQPENSQPVAVAYNSALWTYSTGTGIYSSGGYHLFCIWAEQPTILKNHNGDSLLQYVKQDNGLYYALLTLASGGAVIGSVTNSSVEQFRTATTSEPQEFKDYIGTPQITYNWTSVPSVSGKNGILSLAQIASGSINDGLPVSGASSSAFSSLPDSANVGEIIDGLLPYEESVADVLVKYKIKSSVAGAFSLLKVVAKAGSIPKSVDDGDVVANLNPNKKSKVVSGLAEGTTYYFVIFAEDITGNTAQSEPKSIRTGNRPEEEPGIFEITIDAFKAPQDKQFKETITVSQA